MPWHVNIAKVKSYSRQMGQMAVKTKEWDPPNFLVFVPLGSTRSTLHVEGLILESI
jgi:hypothetical protein